MLSPADDLLISIARRSRLSTADDGFDAIELAAGTPLAVESIDRMLAHLNEAGLVSHRPRPPSFKSSPPFRSFGLTQEGWARVRELEPMTSGGNVESNGEEPDQLTSH
jgi:hypothetical protein